MFVRLLLIALFAVGFVWSPSCTPVTDDEQARDSGGTEKKPTEGDASCQYASECPSFAYTCKDGKCEIINCTSDIECRNQWVCRGGKCHDKKQAPCEKDEHCTDDKLWKCKESKCIDGGCRKDEDCTDEKLPVCDTEKHECIKKKCVSDSDCKEAGKNICDKSTGECGPDTGAKEGEDCKTKPCLRSLRCHEEEGASKCYKPCDPNQSSSPCKSPQICIELQGPNFSGLCLEPGPGLKEGEDCAGGKKCQRHLTCIYTGDGESCRRPCKEDSQCDANKERCMPNKNKKKMCVPKPAPCGPGRSCPGEQDGWQRCSNGFCQLLLCPDDISCPATHKCEGNGKCEPLVCPNEKCPPLYECNSSNRCVRTNEGEKCGQGEKIAVDGCGDGLVCARVGYVSSCVRPCDDAGATCPSDMSCQTNVDGKKICMQSCPSPKKCKYPGYFCVQLKRNPAGNYCVPAGQPSGKDLYEQCDPQNACLPDLTCYQNFRGAGYCIRACSSQAQCGTSNPNGICTSYGGQQACYLKCPNNSPGSCTVGTTRGYCSRSTNGTYICRPI